MQTFSVRRPKAWRGSGRARLVARHPVRDDPEFDEVIHQPVRLAIMSVLVHQDLGTPTPFTGLRNLLQLTDGNLSNHLSRLELMEYVSLFPYTLGRVRLTLLVATRSGREAFSGHMRALERLARPHPIVIGPPWSNAAPLGDD